MCEEFSQCYNDVNICLWTDGRQEKRPVAQSLCTQRNSSLPRVTNSDIQNKLEVFRSAAGQVNLLEGRYFWIDVYTTAINDFHWIDGSSLTGHFIYESAGIAVLEVYSTKIIIRMCALCNVSSVFIFGSNAVVFAPNGVFQRGLIS